MTPALTERLRGGLIVSVQAPASSVLSAPEAIVLLARAAVANGAAGVRIEGAARIGAVVRALPGVPVIGLVKRTYAGYEPYITASDRELAEIAAAGAAIAAFDATGRARPDGRNVGAVLAAIHQRGLLAMADASNAADAAAAAAAGAAIVGTTLAGYTPATAGRPLPALDVVAALRPSGAFAICEGGIGSPDDVRAAFAAGADAVVVGTALTGIDLRVRAFADACP